MAGFCPSCRNVMTTSEIASGVCPMCRVSLGGPKPDPAPTTPEDPTPPPPRPMSAPVRKTLATTLFLIGVGSFFLPFGMFPSMNLGFRKGGSRCAFAGCERETEQKVPYHDDRALPPVMGAEPNPDEEVGYCSQHVAKAPRKMSVLRGKSFSGMIAVFVFMGGPFLFALYYLGFYLGAFFGEPGYVLRLALMTAAAVFAVNGASYLYWRHLHWGLTHSGW